MRLLQRQPKEEEEEPLQAKGEPRDTTEVAPSLEDRINSLRDGGSPMAERVRAYFDPRFRVEFSQVRVHADAHAGELARSVNARAFAVGRDIVFGAGQYAPETEDGKRLLAHELVHTIQQSESKVGQPAAVARQASVAGTQPAQPACPVAALTPITDPDALAMEGGTRVLWNNTSPGLQTAANRLVTLIQAEPSGTAAITSAWRPQAYQDHLREVWDKAHALQGNTSPVCNAVRTAVNQEMANHDLTLNRPVATVSPHTAGNAVDISWSLPNAANEEARVDALASQAGLRHPLHAGDRPHFVL
jgi:Domain of unknown function (DUF4157)